MIRLSRSNGFQEGMGDSGKQSNASEKEGEGREKRQRGGRLPLLAEPTHYPTETGFSLT